MVELALMKDVSLRDFPSAKKRREFLEDKLNIKLEKIGEFNFTENQVSSRNIENLIGAAQIPMGVAGSLLVNDKTFFIPLATTEGALVASVSRGAKVLTASNGANVYVENVGMTRGPIFKAKNLGEAMKTQVWIEKNFKHLAKIAESTSSHLKLLKTEYSVLGKNLFVRFSYDTGDAMGMNMVTIATEKLARLIEEKTGVECIALAGNFDIDKKPAWLNFIAGRGKKIWAEVIVPKKIVKEALKVTPEKIVEVVQRKTHLGSILSGSLGFNSHFANIVAAIFAATGQDLAHVVEGSLGVTDAEIEKNGDLYFSIYLPSIQIGTVGGGTHLPTQQEALKILKVTKGRDFTKVLGAVVLAGELSLIASLAEGTLAKTHQKLGRGKK